MPKITIYGHEATAARFTVDNTADFSADKLRVLNAAFDAVMDIQHNHPDADDNTDAVWAMIEDSLADNINNAWQAGMDCDALISALDPSWSL